MPVESFPDLSKIYFWRLPVDSSSDIDKKLHRRMFLKSYPDLDEILCSSKSVDNSSDLDKFLYRRIDRTRKEFMCLARPCNKN